MRVRRPLFDNHPVEPSQQLNILIVGQHQLNGRTVFEFRVDGKREFKGSDPFDFPSDPFDFPFVSIMLRVGIPQPLFLCGHSEDGLKVVSVSFFYNHYQNLRGQTPLFLPLCAIARSRLLRNLHADSRRDSWLGFICLSLILITLAKALEFSKSNKLFLNVNPM
jgi:hypothetical protein